ncbi:sensor histidine kinase [Salisediminibacterium selenitireducens]|uniref:Sensor histidine kinase n=1 Tax=Bacillus selenitireducens (strain ATCC 700615 / DSM 15326 / MLS10) TaxID=439292 RepID=D6XT07_BACIE|nr:sensor histidine kinase [Salisediminibacterium selenitireducens]ADH98943.1 integral membrane sensor signal transduction histidine kinase [[Bacillus] selenitireducens MLS10]
MKNRTQYVIATISAFLIMAAGILTLVVHAFEDLTWQELFVVELFDVPVIAAVTAFAFITGAVFAALTQMQFTSGLQKLRSRLDGILQQQPAQQAPDDGNGIFTELHEKAEQIRTQLIRQQEAAQKLATERATDREKSLQEVVEQERSRLARELHDSVSQQLFAASMMMATINESESVKDPVMTKQLKMVGNMVDQSQLEMRALLLHLRPAALKGRTLGEGLRQLLSELRQKVPLDIDVKLEELALDKGIEDHLFRITQEAVSNTLRHAGASVLSVILVKRDGNVILRIRDDGKGFDMKAVQHHGSYGMDNMRERAEEIGGTFKLVSVPEEGTQLEVKVPVTEGEVEA